MIEYSPHILIIDDDDRLRVLLTKYLRDQGFMVTAAADVAQARRLMAWFAFDLIVLDIMMPGESGLEMLSSLKHSLSTPVLMLSAMSEAEDRIHGLEKGAEDYLAKPFEPKELVLRIKTILRRSNGQPSKPAIICFGNFQFDPAMRELQRGNETLYLTAGEAAMLKILAHHGGMPVSREVLAAAMPGGLSERSVDVQITRLRKKIEDSSQKPRYLQTVRGKGYVLYLTPKVPDL